MSDIDYRDLELRLLSQAATPGVRGLVNTGLHLLGEKEELERELRELRKTVYDAGLEIGPGGLYAKGSEAATILPFPTSPEEA